MTDTEKLTTDAMRSQFEDAAFAQYFISHISRNPSPPPGPCGALDFIVEDVKDKDVFLARDGDGDYVEATLNSAWWAWQESAKSVTDTEQLSLAMEAIEEADGIVSQVFYAHGDDGDWWCECCHRVVNTTSQISRTTHKGNCDLARYLELRKKLEATNG